jgi:hypothetical protein
MKELHSSTTAVSIFFKLVPGDAGCANNILPKHVTMTTMPGASFVNDDFKILSSCLVSVIYLCV